MQKIYAVVCYNVFIAGKSNIYSNPEPRACDFVSNHAESGQFASLDFPKYAKISYNGKFKGLG